MTHCEAWTEPHDTETAYSKLPQASYMITVSSAIPTLEARGAGYPSVG